MSFKDRKQRVLPTSYLGQSQIQGDSVVDGKTVVMVRDVSETDRYGRLLRYGYVDGVFVNAAPVADGWAESVRYLPDTMLADWFDHLAT
jgi:hypothetical protein